MKDGNQSDFEENPDAKMVEEILNVGLKLDASRHVAECERIGRYADDKVRPVRVKVKSAESKSEILKRAKQLKDQESFKHVFISPDLTQKQRKVDKDLRDHVKQFRSAGEENVIIKAGKVVKNLKDNQVIVLYQPLL